jgi:hypothetical protein
MVKQGRPFNLIEHVNHALIEPTFKAFLTRKYLPDEYKTVEAWRQRNAHNVMGAVVSS